MEVCEMTENKVIEGNVVYCCVICGSSHNYRDCNLIQIIKHVPDTKIPSRAKLTIPEFLQLQILTDGSYSVITKLQICKGTQFGPFIADKTITLDPLVTFPLKIFAEDRDGTDYYFDVNDENRCNWMIFVSSAEYVEEQNLICYQEKGEIFYVAIKDIEPGNTLKVWYSPYYAHKMDKKILSPKPEESVQAINVDINSLIKEQQNIIERKIWTCKFCGQIESDVVSFAKHILKHYTAQLKKMCEICSKTFATIKSLKNHVKVVHGPPIIHLQEKPSKQIVDSNKSKDISLGGPLLTDIFADSSDLEQTDLSEFDINIDNQQLLLDNDNLIVENLLNDNVKDLEHFNFEIDDNQKQFVCDICLKEFSKVKLLIIHLRHHTGDFMCFKCLKVFCRKENLKSHICNTEFQYTCNLCNKSFTQRKYLSRHLEAIHDKKFECSNCKKVYYSNKELREHNCCQVPETEKEVFACPICGKEFYRKNYLKKHSRVHKPKTKSPSKPSSLICEVCGLCLENRNSYYLHKKKHKEPTHICTICRKRFYRQDALNTHILSHQNNSEVECPICQKKFKTIKILRSHMKYHSDEKQYRCSLCNATFKQRWSLSKHNKNHHGERRNNCSVFEYYECPICDKTIKLKSSLFRHLKKLHSSEKNNIDFKNIKPKFFTASQFQEKNLKKKKAKQEVENKTADPCGDLENELNAHINKILNDTENNAGEETIDRQAVDSLVKELDIEAQKEVREVCVSIPDLTENDQEIMLDKNAYILENGTIVQPQENSDNVIIYMLDHPFQ